MTVAPETGLEADTVFACPHCFTGDGSAYTIANRYDVRRFQTLSPPVEPSQGLDEQEWDTDLLTERQAIAYFKVKIENKSYTDTSNETEFNRGSVYSGVKEAVEKFQD